MPLRLLMEGEVEANGKKTPLSIEKQDLDYKQVGPLYESHYQTYRLSGLVPGALGLILADYLPWHIVFVVVAAFIHRSTQCRER